jgi:hypothetical protein
MRFEAACRGWHKGRLTQSEAAELLGVCARNTKQKTPLSSLRNGVWQYIYGNLPGCWPVTDQDQTLSGTITHQKIFLHRSSLAGKGRKAAYSILFPDLAASCVYA